MDIKLYNIDNRYIDYLSPHAPHLFHNKKPGQQNERKFIGVILQVNGLDYFAPLSSFKPKHQNMSDMIDFIKVKNYAVINLNTISIVICALSISFVILPFTFICHFFIYSVGII